MKFYRPPAFQLYGFIISMPVIDYVLHVIMFGDRLYSEWQLWAFSFPLLFLLGMGSWYLHYQYDHYIRARFPELRETSRRVAYKLLVNLLVMTPSIFVILFLYDQLHLFGYDINAEDIKWALVQGLCVNLVFETLWEVVYILEKYKESLSEKEQMEQMSIQQEFDNLKSQVNPHFLFNCFNTLASLISEDKQQAESFLNELSKVYRYLLRTNEWGLATLETEMKFIDSYCRLLKTRHGDGLQFNFEIDRRYNAYQLPSLSLQLVVENAVKHNIVSKQQPLLIEIFTTSGHKLVVNNNLQRKKQQESSTKIGLQNIRAKYKLLRQEGFQVMEGEKHFMVVMPLLYTAQPE
ncbi:sensor histidine kinase [Flavihumibacter petaseus]|uniref:Putative two-component histidine kinase n=1 Tax=Flavihumibacter petaseus NBRC 106054 TaxID=1220578 RepID=A0A0E9MVW8_9BACT|nr:histidine kinase [Flavihumibacter petaseus]GAO41867.1 putative two-component histidine kinase [Flavihumibacter petaseus NBRC 106054]